MFIGHETIAKVFNELGSRIHKAEADYCLTGFVPLSVSVKPYTEHQLYIVSSPEELENFRLHKEDLLPYMNLLILNPEEKAISLYLPEDIPVNYTELFTEDEDGVIRKLRDFFNDAVAGGLMADSILEMLFRDRSIQDMLESFTRGFNNPVFVFDAGFHLIAANYEMVKNEENAERIIRNGGLSDEDFKYLNYKDMPYDVIRKSETPVRLKHKNVAFEQMICAIDTKKDMGHIVVNAVNRPFKKTDEKLVVMLKEGIHQQMIKQDFVRNNAGFPYEYFLKDLLDGKIAARQQTYNRMDYVNSEFSDNMYCLVVEAARTPGTLNTFRIKNEFDTLIPGTKSLMYNGEIVVIFVLRSGEDLKASDMKKIRKLCKDNSLYAGMSNKFRNIMDIAAYYKQALRALEIGADETNDPGLYMYGEHYMQHVINIFSNASDIQAFCHPKLQVLLDYDKTNGTDLAYSLYMYLTHERNSISASEAMFIHRNTLLYRLKKVDSIVDIDYDDYDERRYIILSYEMFRGSI